MSLFRRTLISGNFDNLYHSTLVTTINKVHICLHIYIYTHIYIYMLHATYACKIISALIYCIQIHQEINLQFIICNNFYIYYIFYINYNICRNQIDTKTHTTTQPLSGIHSLKQATPTSPISLKTHICKSKCGMFSATSASDLVQVCPIGINN